MTHPEINFRVSLFFYEQRDVSAVGSSHEFTRICTNFLGTSRQFVKFAATLLFASVGRGCHLSLD